MYMQALVYSVYVAGDASSITLDGSRATEVCHALVAPLGDFLGLGPVTRELDHAVLMGGVATVGNLFGESTEVRDVDDVASVGLGEGEGLHALRVHHPRIRVVRKDRAAQTIKIVNMRCIKRSEEAMLPPLISSELLYSPGLGLLPFPLVLWVTSLAPSSFDDLV